MTKISETKDYAPLVSFFVAQGLEFEEGEGYGDDEVVKAWRADDEAGALAGACVLATREGKLICDGIATAESLRGTGVGRELLFLLLEEARKFGADEVFLVARAPAFFAKYGFEEVARADAPEFFECFTCPQYGKTCNPQVMHRKL